MDSDLAALTCGQGLRYRDMSPEERAAKSRADAARRSRAYRARQRAHAAPAPELSGPEPHRLREGLTVASILFDKITLITGERYRRVARLLGTVDRDEVISSVLIKTANGFANSPWTVEEMVAAAEWLSLQPGLPDLSGPDSDAPHLARPLLAYTTKVASNAVADAYRAHATTTSLDALESVLATSNRDIADLIHRGVARVVMTGSRMGVPGGFDCQTFRVIVDSAVTAAGGDDLAELVLDADNLRSDGSLAWGKVADQIITLLCGETVAVTVPADRKVPFAKLLLRAAFAFLPRAVMVAAAASGAQRATWWETETVPVETQRETGPTPIRAPIAPSAWLAEIDALLLDPSAVPYVMEYTASLLESAY